jgi:hypothetical protein
MQQQQAPRHHSSMRSGGTLDKSDFADYAFESRAPASVDRSESYGIKSLSLLNAISPAQLLRCDLVALGWRFPYVQIIESDDRWLFDLEVHFLILNVEVSVYLFFCCK